MKLSLATQIFIGHAAVLVTFALVSTFSVLEMHQNQQEIRLVSRGYLHLSKDTAAIETFHKTLEMRTERLFEVGSAEKRRALIGLERLYPAGMSQQIQDAQGKANELLTFAPASEAPFVRELAQRLGDLANRYASYERSASSIFTQLEANPLDRAGLDQQLEDFKQLQSSIGREIRLIRASLENRILERVQKAEQRERRTGLAIIGWSVFAIALGLLATGFSARALRPVKTLIEGVSRIGRGDYTVKLGIRGGDEISV